MTDRRAMAPWHPNHSISHQGSPRSAPSASCHPSPVPEGRAPHKSLPRAVQAVLMQVLTLGCCFELCLFILVAVCVFHEQ
ncbi:hypothetical protein Nmel_007539 [Mimus melanotis]